MTKCPTCKDQQNLIVESGYYHNEYVSYCQNCEDEDTLSGWGTTPEKALSTLLLEFDEQLGELRDEEADQ